MSGTQDTRVRAKLPSPGPYIGEITNHLDQTYMGGVEVAIKKGIPGLVGSQNSVYPVQYLSPFYGVTSIRHEGNNSNDFDDVQKSYGMWMVPPDIGTQVLVIFIDGDPNQGYWFGCVQDRFQNHMVPGLAASQQSSTTAEQLRKYGTTLLPVAEMHKKSQTLNSGPNVDKRQKAVHPFADRLLAQGLLLDTARGVTSSSARREIPSNVFGISTPGPLDTGVNAKKGKIGYGAGRQVPVSRLGGSTFVMDDGDVNGQNELVRIRTRTGHQILLHNSQDLIYIGNARGTSWIELTGDGKMDIYCEDSVSIHTEADFNFRAERDFNLEAGRNVNIKANKNINLESAGDFNLRADRAGRLHFVESANIKSDTELRLAGDSAVHLKGDAVYQSATGNFNISGKTNFFTASGDTNISSGGMHFETAAKIHMNGPSAGTASPATDPATPGKMISYSLPSTDKNVGWSDGNFFKGDPITSIMQRVPMHEPWVQHENINSEKFNKSATDVTIGSDETAVSANRPSSTGQ